MARPESWAITDAGNMTIIAPQTRLRHSAKQAPPFRTNCLRKNNLRDSQGLLAWLMTRAVRHVRQSEGSAHHQHPNLPPG
jgi:hypothetical protein